MYATSPSVKRSILTVEGETGRADLCAGGAEESRFILLDVITKLDPGRVGGGIRSKEKTGPVTREAIAVEVESNVVRGST